MAARPLLTESEILCRQLGSTWQLAYLLRQLGLIAWHQGNLAQAEAYTQEALALARELGDKSLIANTLQNLGYFASLQGDLKQAGACYREGLSLAQEIGNEVQMCWPLVGLASVAAAEGQPVRAARLFGAAETRLDVKVLMNNIEHAEYERVVQSARAQLGEKAFAAAWAEGRAMTPEQILTAQEPEPLSEQLPRVPQATTTTKTSPTYPAGLTAREVEILRLVAQGLTDAQVAEELVISPRTVNWHLTAIYSKIQVSSRSAATRYAIEQHLV
jgi:ATP/maltotriose-dependent transcriptional regulator MalT